MQPAKTVISVNKCARASRILRLVVLPLVFYFTGSHPVFSQTRDSAAVLKTVNVEGVKKQNNFTSTMPVQSLSRELLQQINAQSAGDAARYFSGALVKDYGGTGGLKTISVRSLGASSSGIIYDGIPVSDLQTGQVDLSRFSTTFIESLELQQGSVPQLLSPARAYASAAALIISSNTFKTKNFVRRQWQAGAKAGSFNYWQPFAGIYQPLKNNAVISVNAEALYSKGDYPLTVENGSFSEKTRRSNASIKSIQADASLLKQFADSGLLQVKTGLYSSERGLPGAIVFFNGRSVQRLWNTDFFIQGRYQKKIRRTALLVSAKYSNTYTRYTDPDFLNNQGGLDNRYRQEETYMSVAASRPLSSRLLVSAASDIAYNTLTASVSNFAYPKRISLWNNIALLYTRSRWQVNAVLLYTSINDKTAITNTAASNHKFTPGVVVSVTPSDKSPLLFRFFYKTVFRMPTFNDLYYNFIGNSALKPEFTKQYNAGITYTRQFNSAVTRIGISGDVYYNEVKDKIIAVPNQNLFVWTMLNLGKVSIKGIDINAEAAGKITAAAGWFARIAYTWQQATDITDKTSASYKNRIPYTPDHSGSGLLSYNYRKWNAGYSALFSGTRYTLGQNNFYNQLDGWLTHDVFVARRIDMKRCSVQIKGEINNLSGERFDIVRYFPMPGRSFKISLLFNNLYIKS